MQTSKCKNCGRSIFSAATICPGCGTKDPVSATGFWAEVERKQKAPDFQAKSRKTFLICLASLLLVGAAAVVYISHSESTGSATAQAASAQSESDELDACHLRGRAMAVVSIANLKKLNDTGLTLVDMRDRGCTQEFSSKGPECVRTCERGFTSEAKSFLK